MLETPLFNQHEILSSSNVRTHVSVTCHIKIKSQSHSNFKFNKMSATIVTSINPLLIFSQFTGFNLFSIDTKKWKAVVTLWDFFLIINTILGNIIVHHFYWNSYYTFDIHGTKVVQSSIPKLIFVNLISYTLAQVWLFLRRQNFVKMLKIAYEIDEKFLDLYLKIDYHKQKRRLIISIITFTSLATTLVLVERLFFDFYEMKVPKTLSFLQIYFFVCSTIIIHHLILGFRGIKHRFEQLNTFMKHNPHLLGEYLMKKLATLHFQICELIKAFNKVYGFIIVITVASGFGWFCLFLFMAATGKVEILTQFFFVAMIDILIHSINCVIFFFIIKTAESVKREGNATKIILYKHLHKSAETRYHEMLHNFIYQIDNSNMEISSELFDLNWKFFLKVRKFSLNIDLFKFLIM